MNKAVVSSPFQPVFRGRPVVFLVAAALALAACNRNEPPLPGPREPVRISAAAEAAEEATRGAAPIALPPERVNADWTHRNGTAGGGGAGNPTLAAVPQLRWSATIGEGEGKRSRILTAPVVAGGLIFTMDAAGRLCAWLAQNLGLRPDAIIGLGELTRSDSPGNSFYSGPTWKEVLTRQVQLHLAALMGGGESGRNDELEKVLASLQSSNEQLQSELALALEEAEKLRRSREHLQAGLAAAEQELATLSADSDDGRPRMRSMIDDLPREGRDFVMAQAFLEERKVFQVPPDVDLKDMLSALKDVLTRADMFSHHHVQMETLSVRERMSRVMDLLRSNPYMEFHQFFTVEEGRMGVVVTFLALMELTRERLIDLVQNEPMGRIYIKSPGMA